MDGKTKTTVAWISAIAIAALLGWWSLGRGSGCAAPPPGPDADAALQSEANVHPVEPVRTEPAGERSAREAVGAETDPTAPPVATEEPTTPRRAVEEPTTLEFWGKLVHSETRAPVAGASITAELEHAVSDASGLFHLTMREDRTRGYRVRAEGYSTRVFEPGHGHAAPEDALVIELSRSGTLEVEVISRTSLDPSELRIRLTTELYQVTWPTNAFLFGDELTWSAECDEAGVARLIDLPSRAPLQAEILHGIRMVKRIGEPILLEPGDARRLRWVLGGGTRLQGHALDQSGDPVTGQFLWLTRRVLAGEPTEGRAYFYSGDDDEVVHLVETQDDGSFAFEDVEPGRWWLGPAAERLSSWSPRKRSVSALAMMVDVPEGATQHEVTLRCYRGLFLSGVILDPEGRPTRGSVNGRPVEGLGFERVVTGDDGRFRLGPLGPGAHRLRANSWGEYSSSDELIATAGDEGLTLRLHDAGGVTGRVVADGLAGASPRILWSRTDGAFGHGSTTLAEDGAFALEGLRPGDYALVAVTSDGRVGFGGEVTLVGGRSVDAGEIGLEEGAHLAIRYVGRERYCNFKVLQRGAAVAFDGLHTGTSRTHTVPAGRLEVVFSIRTEVVGRREVDIGAGENREVLFELE